MCFMKHTGWKRAVSLGLLGALAVPAALAASPEEVFSQKLADLIAGRDSSAYFSRMELAVGSDTLTVDGETRTLDAAPELLDGQVMLPLRAIAEAAGAQVGYDSQSRSAIIDGAYGDRIICPIGQDTVEINGLDYTVDVPSYIKNGRTVLSVQSVQDVLELEVKREGDRITITSPYQTGRITVWHEGELDTAGLGAEAVITDGTGLWVLQFQTPTQARLAVEALREAGITAEPDQYVPLIQDPEDGAPQ